MKVRKAKLEDTHLLAKMNLELIQDEGSHNPMGLEELQKRMIGFLESDYKAVIFENSDRVEGYCLWKSSDGEVYIRQFFICETQRKKGKGRYYFQELKKLYWADTKLKLEVLVNNPQGLKFWQSLGFNEYSVTMECE